MSSAEFRESIYRKVRIDASLAGHRIDKAAATLLPEFSRTQLAGWLRDGSLTLDGQRVAAKHRVFGGEWLALEAVLEPAARWDAAQAVPFDVVFEDAHLLVVNKPAGIVVHPGAGNPDRTLVNGLLRLRPELERLPRAGIVHRLDKDTSGLLIVAADSAALRALTAALQRHAIRRRYAAVVEGVLTGGRTIDAPLGRDSRNRLRQRVTATGREAVTRVGVDERFRGHTLLTAELATGRTHQIRVHLASIGHPLVGDRLYGARGRLPVRPSAELIAGVRGFRRQALHAKSLEFEHPQTGAALEFAAPLPADMRELIRVLREDCDASARADRA
jgi:23S rRNA pseudouridine1911/1915/1917 synthase